MARNYEELARQLIDKVGGKENIRSLTHCVTRLRFVLNDASKAKTAKINDLDDVIDVIAGSQYQIVIGIHVNAVFEIINQQLNPPGEVTDEKESRKFGFSVLMDVISAIFLPIIPGLIGAGLLQGLLFLSVSLGWMVEDDGVYTVLSAAASSFFYFLPLALAITSAKKFKANPFIAFAVVGAMLYPNLINIREVGYELSFLGIPIVLIDYANSVIPAIVSVYGLSKLEQILNKVIPPFIRGVCVPLILLIIMVPASLILIGPLTTFVGYLAANGYSFLYELSPSIAGLFLGITFPLLIIFGAHWALFPIVMNNFAIHGYDTLGPVTFATNFAMAGAAFAVCVKTKNQDMKQTASAAVFSALVGGITEPAVYGVNLKFKKPFYIACIISGIGGLITGFFGAQRLAFMPVSLLTIPAYASFPGGLAMMISAAVGFFGSFIFTYVFGFNDQMMNS